MPVDVRTQFLDDAKAGKLVLTPRRKYPKEGPYRRQTLSERNAGEGGFWVLYDFKNDNKWELHVHYTSNCRIVRDALKLATREKQMFFSSDQIPVFKTLIDKPPSP